MPSTLFRDYLEMVVGFNEPITKKANFLNSYLGALSGKRDIRAHDRKGEVSRPTTRGPVAERIRDSNYYYSPLSANTYGLTPRKITAKQQRDRE